MSVYYRKLFKINVEHGYYSRGDVLDDIEIRPTHRTLRLLEDHDMLFRMTDLGPMVFYRAERDGAAVLGRVPATEIPDGTCFTFEVRLQNRRFYHFTDLPQTLPPSESLYFFSSIGGVPTVGMGLLTRSIALQPVAELPCKGPAFTETYTLAGDPPEGEMRLTGPQGQTVTTVRSILNDQNEFKAHFEMAAYPPGQYQLQRLNNGSPEGSPETFYWSSEVHPAAVFGIIEIRKEAAWEQIHSFNSNPSVNYALRYDIPFDHLAKQWIYKLVFKYTDISGKTVSIDETFATIAGNRYHQNPATDKFFFTQLGPPGVFDGNPMLTFKSVDAGTADKAYPIYEEAKKNLNLRIDGDIHLSGLPNPDLRNGTTDVIVFV